MLCENERSADNNHSPNKILGGGMNTSASRYTHICLRRDMASNRLE